MNRRDMKISVRHLRCCRAINETQSRLLQLILCSSIVHYPFPTPSILTSISSRRLHPRHEVVPSPLHEISTCRTLQNTFAHPFLIWFFLLQTRDAARSNQIVASSILLRYLRHMAEELMSALLGAVVMALP